jgi:hypothetical protein
MFPTPPPQPQANTSTVVARLEDVFFFKYWAIKNKYEDDYKQFQPLIRTICVKIPRIVFKALHFEFMIFNIVVLLLKRNAYRILMGKPEGKTLLRRPRRRWEGNIEMDLREGWYGLD